jgi:hypothetical protein
MAAEHRCQIQLPASAVAFLDFYREMFIQRPSKPLKSIVS